MPRRYSFRNRASARTGLDPYLRNNGSPLWRQAWEPNMPEVTDTSVLGLPAAWRCIDLLTSVVGGLPLHSYRGDTRAASTPQILDRPNQFETRAETIASIVYSLVMRGNAYLLLGGWDNLMRPTSFEVVHPDMVNIDTTSGEPLYKVGSLPPLTRYEIVHIRWLKVPGSVYGVGPVEAARTGLQNVLSVDSYGRSAWTSNGVPSAVITVEDPTLSPDQAAEIQDRWIANTSGTTRRPTVLPSAMKVDTIAFSPQDAEFLATKVHTLTEVALIFGVPATKLGAPGPSATYTNAQDDDAYFAKFTILPILGRIEAPLSDLLPRGTVAKFEPDALLRPNTERRYTAHKLALDGGWMTVNEVRQIEHLEPLPDGDRLPSAKPLAPPPDQNHDAPLEVAA